MDFASFEEELDHWCAVQRRADYVKAQRAYLGREAKTLTTLKFTDAQLAVFDERVAGIQERYRKVIHDR